MCVLSHGKYGGGWRWKLWASQAELVLFNCNILCWVNTANLVDQFKSMFHCVWIAVLALQSPMFNESAHLSVTVSVNKNTCRERCVMLCLFACGAGCAELMLHQKCVYDLTGFIDRALKMAFWAEVLGIWEFHDNGQQMICRRGILKKT